MKSLTQGRERACLQLETALDPQFGEGSANDAMAIDKKIFNAFHQWRVIPSAPVLPENHIRA